MPILLGVLGLFGATLCWLFRTHGTVKHLREIDRETKGLQRRAAVAFHDIVGTPLERVRDPRLAATILMIQLVRTGSPLTASEKTKILDLMEERREIVRISATFETAWTYTQARLPFSRVADPLTPLLREALTRAERDELIAILTQVAGAHSAPSELQRNGIAHLKRRLLAGARDAPGGR